MNIDEAPIRQQLLDSARVPQGDVQDSAVET
jgi:hypothetical protein